MVANRTLDASAPSLGEVIDTLMGSVWKQAVPADAYFAELQRVADNAVLYNLMSLAASATPQVHAVASLKIERLRARLAKTPPVGKKSHVAHFKLAVREIDRLFADPPKYVFPEPAPMPLWNDRQLLWRG